VQRAPTGRGARAGLVRENGRPLVLGLKATPEELQQRAGYGAYLLQPVDVAERACGACAHVVLEDPDAPPEPATPTQRKGTFLEVDPWRALLETHGMLREALATSTKALVDVTNRLAGLDPLPPVSTTRSTTTTAVAPAAPAAPQKTPEEVQASFMERLPDLVKNTAQIAGAVREVAKAAKDMGGLGNLLTTADPPAAAAAPATPPNGQSSTGAASA